MRRHTTTMLLACAAMFAAVTSLGADGIPMGAAAVGVTVFATRGVDATARCRRAFKGTLVATAALVVMALTVPPASGLSLRGITYHCGRNLMYIGEALHNYHEEWGSFPPAYVADEAGEPAHSWRLVFLPSVPLTHLNHQELYECYDFDEPWDGPRNRRLAFPSYYRERGWAPYVIFFCPAWPGRDAQGALTTRFLAVVGDNTAWPGTEARSLLDIADPEQTILVVECFHRPVRWLEPMDICVEDAAAARPVRVSLISWWLGLTNSSPYGFLKWGWEARCEYHGYMGRHALFADGTVRLLPNDLSAADFRALADIRDVPKPVLPPPPPDHEAVPDVIQRLPLSPAAIRWAGFVLFLAALAAMACSAMPASVRCATGSCNVPR